MAKKLARSIYYPPLKILWIIPARSGSKSISHKNIKKLAGIPLIGYRIKSALTIAEKEDVWVSTDSQEYAGIAQEYGATIPFIRPPELATDHAKSADVVLHAMYWAESLSRKYDAVGLLEPTSPFIKSSVLVSAVDNLFTESEAENIVAVRSVNPTTFYIQEEDKYLSKIAKNIQSIGAIRRQDEKREVTPSGGFYIAKWEAFKQNRSFYTTKTMGYLVTDVEGIEIDEPIDWDWAEFLLDRKKISFEDIT
jgi:CMP-N,N'-diacetyllegionaminic acid synthase